MQVLGYREALRQELREDPLLIVSLREKITFASETNDVIVKKLVALDDDRSSAPLRIQLLEPGPEGQAFCAVEIKGESHEWACTRTAAA